MQQYIGTKIIQAEPAQKDWKDGYKVVYPDGYESWSPKDTFEEAYRATTAMTFGLAVEAMRKGMRVARAGWNGKGMWVTLVSRVEWASSNDVDAVMNMLVPFLVMKATDGSTVPWLASLTDVLAEDWSIVE